MYGFTHGIGDIFEKPLAEKKIVYIICALKSTRV